MQKNCKYKSASSSRPGRRALTLIELVVVLAILVALSGLVVPMISGLGHQTNASANATIIGEVDRAVGAFHARNSENNQYPNYWDSLLNEDGTLFGKLHPALSGANPSVYGPALIAPHDLDTNQVKSLTSAGIHNLYRAVPASSVAPSLNQAAAALKIVDHPRVALLEKSASASAYAKFAFSPDLRAADHEDAVNNEFVVLGLAGTTTIRGATIIDVPIIQSVDPTHHYGRVLCVFMIPGSGTNAEFFPAKYVGCFLPDGTSLRNNLSNYNNAVDLN